MLTKGVIEKIKSKIGISARSIRMKDVIFSSNTMGFGGFAIGGSTIFKEPIGLAIAGEEMESVRKLVVL